MFSFDFILCLCTCKNPKYHRMFIKYYRFLLLSRVGCYSGLRAFTTFATTLLESAGAQDIEQECNVSIFISIILLYHTLQFTCN